jgi:hypothetical protein
VTKEFFQLLVREMFADVPVPAPGGDRTQVGASTFHHVTLQLSKHGSIDDGQYGGPRNQSSDTRE